MPRVPRKAGNSAVKHMSRPRHRPMADTTRTSWLWREGIIHAPMTRLKPLTPTITQHFSACRGREE
jgi:hypothetical protein